jgi:hypothetical protein
MADTVDEYIAQQMREIDELLAKADAKKRIVNQVSVDRGLPPRYPDATGDIVVRASGSATGTIKRDQFHARPMATAIREYLQMRGPSDRGGLGAATVNEIYTALVDGGFGFETKNDLNAKRGLRDALTKNTVTFHRVGDAYGLVEWYPKPQKPAKDARGGKKSKSKGGRAKKTATGKKLGRPKKVEQPVLQLVGPGSDLKAANEDAA